MFAYSLALVWGAGLIELFTPARMSVLVPYVFIFPILILVPRLILVIDKKFKEVVSSEWLKQVEVFIFLILAFNVPGSLVFHDLGFQYDRFLHFVVAFLALLTFSLLWLPVMKVNKEKIEKKKILIILFLVLFFSLFLWEMAQFSIDYFFNTKLFFDSQQSMILDFSEDILFGILGLIFGIIYINKKWNSLLETLEGTL